MDKISSIAVKITDKLTAGGITLSIKDDSLLAPAAGELRDLFPKETVSAEELTEEVNKAAAITDDAFLTEEEIAEKGVSGLGDVYGHCVTSICEPMLPVVAGVVAKIKDQVIPTANTLFDEAYKQTTEHIEHAGIHLKIVTDGSELPIWNTLIGMLSLDAELASSGAESDIVKGFSFPEKSEEAVLSDIQEMCGETYPAVQALIQEDSTTVAEYYNYTFNVGAGKPFTNRKLQALVTAALATRYADDIPEGIEGVSLEAYNKCVLDLLRANAAAITYQVSQADKYKMNDRLVISYPAEDRATFPNTTIVVNGKMYDEWLEAGGSVDAIYGAYLNDRRAVSGNDILERRGEFERAWTAYVLLLQSASNDHFESHFKRNILAAISRHCVEIKTPMKDAAYDYVEGWTTPISADNAYTFGRTAIILGVFGDGDHLRIVEAVDHIAAKNKGIELADAIDIALVDWLVDWALKQVTIGKV